MISRLSWTYWPSALVTKLMALFGLRQFVGDLSFVAAFLFGMRLSLTLGLVCPIASCSSVQSSESPAVPYLDVGY